MIKKVSSVLATAVLVIFGVAARTQRPNGCTCKFKATACGNASLTKIPSDISKDTIDLRVSYNSIAALHKTDLMDLSEVKIISMNDNVIKQIDPEVFHPLRKLRRLYLNNNHITDLNFQTFRWNKALKYLFLQNNRIRFIDPRLFKYILNLKALDISRNYIATLEPNTFQNNHLLSWVNIRQNLDVDVMDWKPILKCSFNFLEIQFCELKLHGFNVNVGASRHKRDKEESQEIRNKANKHNKRTATGNNLTKKYSFIKPKNLSFEEYDSFIRTVSYDEYSTIITRENSNITLLTDYPIFCYCTEHFLWFWCNEIEAKCSKNNSLLIMSTNSQCSSLGSSTLLSPTSTLPTSAIPRHSEGFGSVNKSGGSNNNVLNPITYTWIAVGIATIAIM